jgi:hypothetical protein
MLITNYCLHHDEKPSLLISALCQYTSSLSDCVYVKRMCLCVVTNVADYTAAVAATTTALYIY